MRQYLVSEIMSQPATVVKWDASILDVSAKMEEHDVRRLPVVDDENVVIGIISSGDLREALSVYSTANPYAPEQDEILLEADEVMTSPVRTVRPEDSLLDVVRLMVMHKIGGVPVVDVEGRPVGVVTESDIFRLILRIWEAEEAGDS